VTDLLSEKPVREPIRLFDCDSHVSEPTDLWTARLGSRYDPVDVPHVERRPDGSNRWIIGKHVLNAEAKYAQAGWHEYPPKHPPSLAEADPASWNPDKRLERMDEYGVQAQILYPNIVAFSHWAFTELEHSLGLACVEAYNDFLIDFASSDPTRLLPIMMLPFWDVEACRKEIERSARKGHRGVLLAGSFERVGLPGLADPHWRPVLEALNDHGLSVNFHIGVGRFDAEEMAKILSVPADEHVGMTSSSMLNNGRAIADVICRGVCHRYPEMKFVSVESGAGWLPYLAESMDWHWKSFGAHRDHPDRELPSFYLRRQVYGSFWFERDISHAVGLFPDNIMFETDFPHPTSLSPGPASPAGHPLAMAEAAVADLPDEVRRKILFETGAKLYGVV
jgi:predicted TIM-barrel fold metal-dependent hydrolase